MTFQDYNGLGRWSRWAIQNRYVAIARRLRVAEPSDLRPHESICADGHRVFPVMYCVIEGIERGDPACIEIDIEFIEEDMGFPFGMILKSNTARALRRATLTEVQQERVRKRVVEMLIAGNTPKEYGEYARLARKIGLGRWWAGVEGRVNLTSRRVRRFYDYFRRFVAGCEPGS